MLAYAPFAKFRHALLWLALSLPAGRAVANSYSEDPPNKASRPAPGKKHAAGPLAPPTAPVAPSASAPSPSAPQLTQVRGIVLTPEGRPCAGASVYPAGAPRQLVVTDAQGAFELPVPAGAAVSLRVEYFGEGSSRVEVPAPGTSLVRVTLGQ
jgi:hypothetical protein